MFLLKNMSWCGLFLVLSACSSAPTFSVFGAFFPSWLICVGIGFLTTLGSRLLFLKLGYDKLVSDRLEVYASIGTIVGLLTWMLFFGW